MIVTTGVAALERENFLEKFEGLYREHMFLRHPLVPRSVKQSQSHIINVEDLVSGDTLDQTDTKASLLQGLQAFEGYTVIRLQNLQSVELHH